MKDMPFKVALDANAFIGAVNPTEPEYNALRKIFAQHTRVTIYVSVHTLSELRPSEDALALAKNATLLPHFLIGTWEDQVATWDQVAGTWADQRLADEKYQDLRTLAKSGAGIRDLGAYVDALYGEVDVFVTSDLDMAGRAPMSRIISKYRLRIMTPRQFADELMDRDSMA